VGPAIADSCLLAVSCLITYWRATTILALAAVSKADNALGAMWAVIATVFVFRHSYQKSLVAVLSRWP
jgi:hypothetical protein